MLQVERRSPPGLFSGSQTGRTWNGLAAKFVPHDPPLDQELKHSHRPANFVLEDLSLSIRYGYFWEPVVMIGTKIIFFSVNVMLPL